MGQTRAIFFWLSGIITPSFQTILSRALADLRKTGINLPGLPDLQSACDDLVLGKASDLDFCRRVEETIHLGVDPAVLQENILSEITPNPHVAGTIQLLPEKYERWLLVDLPRRWFEQVCKKLVIADTFSPERLFFLPESGLARLVPEIFDRLPEYARLSIKECLIIDANSKRAVQALNHGLPAALFTSAKQLEREFTMRYFIEKPQPMHKPVV